MTFCDTVDLVVSGALWLRARGLNAHEALDVVWRTYRTTSVRAVQAGWSCHAERDLAERRARWQARGAR